MSYAATAKWILAIGVAATIILYAFADPIADYSKAGNPLIALAIYYLSQTTMFLTIFVSILYTQAVHKSIWRGLVGGTILSVFFGDITSLPHCVSALGFPMEAVNYACSDTLIIKMLVSAGVPFGVSYTFYYLVIPIMALFFGFMILGKVGFTEFFGGNKMRR
jgi:hypothetical protein